MTNLVQFPGLGLSFELSRVAFSIGDMDIYWYGVCIAFGLCLALVFAFRRCTEFGIDADSMVDVILISVVLGIASARLYYVAMAPYNYDTIWDVLAVRDGGLAIYGGIIGAFVFGGLACKWRGVPVLPMFDLAGMGFLIGQGCGRWGNFFNQEAFGCMQAAGVDFANDFVRAVLTLDEPTLDDTMPDTERLARFAQDAFDGCTEVRLTYHTVKKLAKTLREANFKVQITGTLTDGVLTIMDVSEKEDAPLYGCAIDIGTTTVTGVLMDLKTGTLTAKASAGNGQIRYGADVINRIVEQGKPGGIARICG